MKTYIWVYDFPYFSNKLNKVNIFYTHQIKLKILKYLKYNSYCNCHIIETLL